MLMLEGFSIHGAYVSAGEFDGFRQKQDAHENLPRFAPRRLKTYISCLSLYCWYIWSCYNGAQMQSGGGGRR
jgi:hypothetical protein